jgi:hypothetical protein
MPLLRRSAGSSTAIAADLEPIRIATDQLELTGSVASTGQRVTDLLLRGQALVFLPAGAEPRPEAWITIEPGDVLFVEPPPLPVQPAWRPPTAPVDLAVEVGGYRIGGSAHLPPTTSIDRRLAQDHPFLPLTSASIVREGAGEPEELEVIIVNLARATRYGVR